MTTKGESLQSQIEQVLALSPDELPRHRIAALDAFTKLRNELNAGKVRAAEPDPNMPTGWRVNTWVKAGILLGFRLGDLKPTNASTPWSFFDKSTLPVRAFRSTETV